MSGIALHEESNNLNKTRTYTCPVEKHAVQSEPDVEHGSGGSQRKKHIEAQCADSEVVEAQRGRFRLRAGSATTCTNHVARLLPFRVTLTDAY